MYLDYYRLVQKPFQINTDPDFLWFGRNQKEALATLQYGILENKSFLLLTGDVGVGKTTIVNAFLQGLDRNDRAVVIHDPVLDTLDFFNYVARSFGMSGDFRTKGAFLEAFNDFLLKSYYQAQRVVLIIDECQLLDHRLLSEIRLFSNFEKKGTKLINIFFVGQLEFHDILLRPENRAIRQRIAVHYNIPPLSPDETEKYIEYRMAAAGANRKIFKPGAVRMIHQFSKGYPRLINIIADQALLTGFVKSASRIKKGIVKECARELDISRTDPPAFKNRKDAARTNEAAPEPTQADPVSEADPKTRLDEAIKKLSSVDGETLRMKMDALRLKRSSGIRFVLNRIYRGALGPDELKTAIESEARSLISEDIAELERIKDEADDDSLKPLLDLLWEQFN